MKLRFASVITAAALASLVSVGASARVSGQVDSTMNTLLVTLDAQGREVVSPIADVAPGDVLEYQITYTNLSQSRLRDFQVDGPVPDSTDYLGYAVGAPGASMQVSIDSGETWESEPVTRVIRNAEGRMEQVVIPQSEYTGIRWIGGSLQAGQTARYSYRVIVE